MNATTLGFDWLAEAPLGLLLIARATAVLAAAWVATAALRRANPRWRVLAWRSAALGFVAIVGLAMSPPLLKWHVAPPIAAPAPPMPAQVPPGIAGPGAARIVHETPRPVADLAPVATDFPAPPEPAKAPLDAAAWLVVAWLVGCAGSAARFAVGAWRLARIVGRAQAAPESVARACRETAARLGVARPVRVVETSAIASPCLTGVFRPVVLLPSGRGLDAPGADLEAVLVHELTHVRHGDLFWNDVLNAASIALWFHPLAWRMRSAHAQACDAVCDAVAVDHLGDLATYGRALARLALQASGAVPARGLAMARACDVRRRVDSLQRMVYRSPLPRRFVMPALVLSAALAVLIGGTAVIRAQDDPDKAAARPADPGAKPLTVRALDAATGEPMEGVEVEFRYHVEGAAKSVVEKPVTPKSGEARVEYDPNAKLSFFTFTLRKPGFVPAHVTWQSSRRPIVLPESKELKLAPGRVLEGVVVDEAGKPVEGATVELSMPATEAERDNYYFTFASSKTDAQGRWRVGEAPEDLGRASGRIEHPDYRPTSLEKVGASEMRSELTKGATVTGRVLGPDGKPVAGAKATYGRDVYLSNAPEAKTNENGEFVLKNCDPGSAWVGVEAPGFAPGVADVLVKEKGEETPPVAIALEPGSTLRVRAVDRDGKPLEGVGFAVESWRGRSSVRFRDKTDAEGRIVWNDAPRDAVQVSLYRAGFMSSRKVSMTAGDEEHVVVLNPALVASGSVVDASTRKPIPKFRVIQGIVFDGQDRAAWQRSQAEESTDGRYSARFDEPYNGWRIRIEAQGYKPAESRRFGPDEGNVVEDFAMEAQADLGGVVLQPDGKPAAGAEVALGLPNVFTALEGAKFGRAYNTPVTKADADGRFFFPKPEGPFLIVAAADAGFAETNAEQFAKSTTIQLAPWGRIEGQVFLGEKPGAGERVTYQPDRSKYQSRDRQISVSYSPEVLADPEGRFVMDKVVPMPGYVGRVLITKLSGGMQSHMPVGMKAVEVKPGETARVTIGSEGRAVVGRVVVDGQPEKPIDWTRNQPVRVTIEQGFFDRMLGRNAGMWTTYGGNFDADGRFRVEDVPPGSYKATVTVDAPRQEDQPGMAEQLGYASLSFTVPEGDRAKPVDVGDVVVKLEKLLKIGDEAPAIDVERIDGPKGRFSLAERRGKVVVLDFWATWCGPCIAEMPAMKELQKTFGGDPRFELVGVSCDNGAAVAARYAEKEGLNWTQAFAGPMGTSVAQVYGVRGIPSTFVIGPDGRILAKDLRGDRLAQAVKQALAEMGQ
ncbi:carboxypeptidase regulatory-like domain-containing protein [Planctomyces sp. SH-PL62]|uniref:carboxypeptidase regulatory-like domain-containing protein n=1 Tax=Planctomyces sp. SH-PL62 TaxID=1636152 RepID=UPI00078D4720|nr:carboxypeptidase regulatory-like domain-containing protein [Planctomyces sp. SH-PL62]AMV36284.1 Thiol-disulfide oxidoreductase ResA [Planctomyces sp. SH-PL62]